uniref:Uncharacterized protein n=1 Tax=Cupriavidus pinatubonensis (strain JMP 134 / LMG 1197) TaxID=264198 RepID=Q46YG0_CUPPJ
MLQKGEGHAAGHGSAAESGGQDVLDADDHLPAGSLFAFGEQLEGDGLEQGALGQHRGKGTQFVLKQGVGGVGFVHGAAWSSREGDHAMVSACPPDRLVLHQGLVRFRRTDYAASR